LAQRRNGATASHSSPRSRTHARRSHDTPPQLSPADAGPVAFCRLLAIVRAVPSVPSSPCLRHRAFYHTINHFNTPLPHHPNSPSTHHPTTSSPHHPIAPLPHQHSPGWPTARGFRFPYTLHILLLDLFHSAAECGHPPLVPRSLPYPADQMQPQSAKLRHCSARLRETGTGRDDWGWRAGQESRWTLGRRGESSLAQIACGAVAFGFVGLVS
jgi:hypothetical protein